MLRLVHPPPPGGNGTRPPDRHRIHSLTPEEGRNLRQTLMNLRMRYGTWACLGEVMGVSINTLAHAAQLRGPHGSPGLALRAARAAGTTVEHILAGKLAPVGVCPTCGSTAVERRAR